MLVRSCAPKYLHVSVCKHVCLCWVVLCYPAKEIVAAKMFAWDAGAQHVCACTQRAYAQMHMHLCAHKRYVCVPKYLHVCACAHLILFARVGIVPRCRTSGEDLCIRIHMYVTTTACLRAHTHDHTCMCSQKHQLNIRDGFGRAIQKANNFGSARKFISDMCSKIGYVDSSVTEIVDAMMLAHGHTYMLAPSYV